jgi:hypothetical protein
VSDFFSFSSWVFFRNNIFFRLTISFLFHVVQPSLQVVKLGKNVPVVDGAFVACSATIVGKVKIAKGASVWYGAVLRGQFAEDVYL